MSLIYFIISATHTCNVSDVKLLADVNSASNSAISQAAQNLSRKSLEICTIRQLMLRTLLINLLANVTQALESENYSRKILYINKHTKN